MDQLMFVATIFGPYQLVVGLWMLVHRKNCLKVYDSIRKTPAAIYVMGWTSLLLGLFIVTTFNYWMWNVSLFVPTLGWAYIIRGVIILFIPQLFLTDKNENSRLSIGAVLRLIWGAGLVWIAAQ